MMPASTHIRLKVEEADPILNFVPRGDHRHDAQKRGEQRRAAG